MLFLFFRQDEFPRDENGYNLVRGPTDPEIYRAAEKLERVEYLQNRPWFTSRSRQAFGFFNGTHRGSPRDIPLTGQVSDRNAIYERLTRQVKLGSGGQRVPRADKVSGFRPGFLGTLRVRTGPHPFSPHEDKSFVINRQILND